MGKQLVLTEQQQELVEKNMKLVYFFAEKFVGMCALDRDEIHSVLSFGLCKAAATFDPEKAKLSTYATRCMRNELFMRLRQEKKWRRQAYLSDIASKADRMGEDAGTSFEAFIQDKESRSIPDDAVNKVTVDNLKIWLNTQEKFMNPTTRKVINMWVEKPDRTQAELAQLTTVSQAQVSRILKKIKALIISTFFRGDQNWLYGDSSESELSTDFMNMMRTDPVEELEDDLEEELVHEFNEMEQLFFALDVDEVHTPKTYKTPRAPKRRAYEQLSLFAE